MDSHHRFSQRKAHILKCIASACDNSPKGSIDPGVLPIMELLNSRSDYATTSSCSGRASLYCESVGWLFVSHSRIEASQLPLFSDGEAEKHEELVYLKFEPFIMHVEASSLESAARLLQCAVQSGFRNSGISTGARGRFIVAIRSTLKLDAPIGVFPGRVLLVRSIEPYVKCVNEKFGENERLIERLCKNLCTI